MKNESSRTKKRKKLIPEEFWNGHKRHPRPMDVQGLICQLQRLPKTLPVTVNCGEKAQMCVYNIDRDDWALEIEEVPL